MSVTSRNRVIALALILMLGQLTLVVHATVHNADLNCQLCLSQSHYSKGIPLAKTLAPPVNNQGTEIIKPAVLPIQSHQPRPYLQRAPPVTLDN